MRPVFAFLVCALACATPVLAQKPPPSPQPVAASTAAKPPEPAPPATPKITAASCWTSSCVARVVDGAMRVEAVCKVGEPRSIPILNPNDGEDGIIFCVCCPVVKTAKEMKR